MPLHIIDSSVNHQAEAYIDFSCSSYVDTSKKCRKHKSILPIIKKRNTNSIKVKRIKNSSYRYLVNIDICVEGLEKELTSYSCIIRSSLYDCLQIAKRKKCECVAVSFDSSEICNDIKSFLWAEIQKVSRDFLSKNELTVYIVVNNEDLKLSEPSLLEAISQHLKVGPQEDIETLSSSEMAGSYLITDDFDETLSFGEFDFSDKDLFSDPEREPTDDAPDYSNGSFKRLPPPPPNSDIVFRDKDKEKTGSSQNISSTASNILHQIQLEDSFTVRLIKYIDSKKMSDVQCYNRANVSRQTWHNIITNTSYKPKKKTAISFAIALELTVEETQELLSTAGFSLSDSIIFDKIIKYFLENKKYDIMEINTVLFDLNQDTLSR